MTKLNTTIQKKWQASRFIRPNCHSDLFASKTKVVRILAKISHNKYTRVFILVNIMLTLHFNGIKAFWISSSSTLKEKTYPYNVGANGTSGSSKLTIHFVLFERRKKAPQE